MNNPKFEVRNPKRIHSGRFTSRETGLCFLALVCFVAGCSTRKMHTGSRPLRIRVETSRALESCRYVAPDPIGWMEVSAAIGEKAAERMTQAIRDGLEPVELVSGGEADLVAVPRVAWITRIREGESRAQSVQVASADYGYAYQQQPSRSTFGAVRGDLTYAVDFLLPDNRRVASVEATGSGRSAYGAGVDVIRTLFHIGTLLIFGSADDAWLHRDAFDKAGAQAAEQLRAKLEFDPELRAFRERLSQGSVRQVPGTSAAIDLLLKDLLPRRNLTIAVLDLGALDGMSGSAETYLAEQIRTELARRPGVRTLERGYLSEALKELQLNMTDLVDAENARRFGRQYNADAILTGTVVRFPHEVKLIARVLETETGRIVGAAGVLMNAHGTMPESKEARARGPSGGACEGGTAF